jgi:type IV pilus assembly protein PilQ
MRLLKEIVRVSLVFFFAWSELSIAANNSIENVEFSQQGGQTLIKVSFQSPIKDVPQPFSTSNPYRLAFDFTDTASSLGVTTKNAGIGSLQSVSVVQADARTRMVLNLLGPVQQSTTLDGNALYITLTAKSAMTSSPAQVDSASIIKATSGYQAQNITPLITNVDFQANGADQASLKVELTEPNALLDVRQQGANLILFFSKADIQGKLIRRLDVRDFGTPVASITTVKASGGIQLTLANKGDWDYSVRQIDSIVVLEIKRVLSDPTSLASSKDIQGKVVSFSFTQPVPVGQMIGIFQDITGLNFMVMPGVTGEIQSLKMDNTPVEVAIDIISRMYGLGFRRYGNVVVVGKADDLLKYDKDERERIAALESTDPILQETFKIRYRSASEIVKNLATVVIAGKNNAAADTVSQQTQAGQQNQSSGGNKSGISLISDRGSISYDDATNTVFVEETKLRLGKIRERIESLDRPMRQVLIEARIVQAQDDFSRDLGVKLSASAKYSINGQSQTAAGTPQTVAFTPGYSFPTTATTSVTGISLFDSSLSKIISLELAAGESDAKTKKIASPRILTRDTQKATLINGQAIPYQSSSGTAGATTTSFVNAALTLDVTPQIQQDGRIQLDLMVANDEPNTTFNPPGINKRSITTKVIVENGGTVVIGGMFKQDETNSEDRVPFLGDLPYFGFLFKTKSITKSRSELMVFITPRIVNEDLALH